MIIIIIVIWKLFSSNALVRIRVHWIDRFNLLCSTLYIRSVQKIYARVETRCLVYNDTILQQFQFNEKRYSSNKIINIIPPQHKYPFAINSKIYNWRCLFSFARLKHHVCGARSSHRTTTTITTGSRRKWSAMTRKTAVKNRKNNKILLAVNDGTSMINGACCPCM